MGNRVSLSLLCLSVCVLSICLDFLYYFTQNELNVTDESV